MRYLLMMLAFVVTLGCGSEGTANDTGWESTQMDKGDYPQEECPPEAFCSDPTNGGAP